VIKVDPEINKGKPSILCTNDKYTTIVQVVALYNAQQDGGITREELLEETKLTLVGIEEAIGYARMYPQILPFGVRVP